MPKVGITPHTVNRRQFLSLAATAAAFSAAKSGHLIIDTHLEVWTLNPKFPFHHPEHPEVKPGIEAPIENEVAEMREYGLRYAVLSNPRYYGWDNSGVYAQYFTARAPARTLIQPATPTNRSGCPWTLACTRRDSIIAVK